MKNVRLYWNLNRDCVSVQDAKTKLVLGYARSATIANASFKVSEAGRLRTIRDHCRNVHAWATGELIAADWIETKDDCNVSWSETDTAQAESLNRRVSYNPFKGPHFINVADGTPVTAAAFVTLTGNAQTKAICHAC